MSLKYYISLTKSGYTDNTVLKRFKKEKFSQQLKSDFNRTMNAPQEYKENQLRGYISTQVPGFLFWKKWIVGLDCDSQEDRVKAVEEIRSFDLKYEIIESSPGKFWIIVDYTGSLKKCINFMKSIPGVDTQFINKCERDKRIILRAFPKNGFIPHFENPVPSLDHYSCTSWFYDFKKWWNCGGTVEWLASHQRVLVEERIKEEKEIAKEMKELEEKQRSERELKRSRKRRIELRNE